MKRKIPWIRRMIEAEAHHHIVIALSVAVLVLGALFQAADWGITLILSWDAFTLTTLLLVWGGMLSADTRTRVETAQLGDARRMLIISSLITAAFVSLGGAAYLLREAKNQTGPSLAGHVLLVAVTILLSWSLIHSLVAARYSRLYYANAAKTSEGEPEPNCGLDFRGQKNPDFLDFAYFSFIIGMTFQVSDVEVTSSSMRRLVLVHSLLSFVFNTVIVAFSINLATTLL